MSNVHPLKGNGHFGQPFVRFVHLNIMDIMDIVDESTVCMVINPHHKGDFSGTN